MDVPEWESDESAEGVKKNRNNDFKYDEQGIGMPAEPADV